MKKYQNEMPARSWELDINLFQDTEK